MFRPRHSMLPLYGLRGLHEVVGLARGLDARGPWSRRWAGYRPRRRHQPSVALLLIAGLAVFAFVKLMSATSRTKRSTAKGLVLTTLLLATGAIVLLLRKSARRYRW